MIELKIKKTYRSDAILDNKNTATCIHGTFLGIQ